MDKLPPGTKLTVGHHHITIDSYLSEGGFAHIYIVTVDNSKSSNPSSTPSTACLKRVIVPDKNGLDQLRKEVDVMKKLQHARNIVKYFDSHAQRLESGAYQVLVLMELCPNKSLLDFMNARIKTKLSELEILKILLDISIGVFEMHRLKMIHRDIKIENVLIDKHHNFKLCDFGSTSGPIAPPKSQQEFQALSHDIMYQTTPQYRSPEMIDLYRGFPIDEKLDIWALGCFLYKLCYYTTPFEANGDIAILHASFQFPPHPQFSPDLNNLIIILLQENPVFRPNIVQVIKLVCKMLKVDFAAMEVEDIYKMGSYNFQALHEYQQQRQYYQESVKGQAQGQLPQAQGIKAQAPQTQVSQPQGAQTQGVQTQIPQNQIPQNQIPQTQDPQTQVSQSQPQQDQDSADDTFGEIEDLDDVEERYPSLENIIVEPDTPATVKSSVPTGTIYPEKPVPQMPPPPIQPPILPPQELQKLSPEQLQQYNYHHQAYHYQMNQWIYYQQQQQYQTYPERTSSFRDNKMERTVSNNLQQKEAWEYNSKKVDNDAGKLADDIFASKSRSPKEVQKQKTSQSIKSEPAYDELEVREEIRLTKSNNVSEINLKTKEVKDVEVESEDGQVESHQAGKEIEKEAGKESEKENEKGKEKEKEKDKEKESLRMEKPQIQEPQIQESQIQEPQIQNPQKQEAPQVQNPQKQEPPQNQNNSIQNSPIQIQTPQFQRPTELPTSKFNPFPRDLEESRLEPRAQEIKKSSTNPWGEYRSPSTNLSANVTASNIPPHQRTPSMNNTPSFSNPMPESLHKKMNSLTIEDFKLEPPTSRKPSHEEPNLIDLEVGLDSSSSTPVLATMSSDSLIDIDDTLERRDKPHFRKKVSAIPNPADFKVQEEVIDWASDDENSNSMNRLSIRNSLKSRKSSEQKRSESTSSDKKRLSRLIS